MDFCRSVLIGSWLRKESILVSSGDSPSGILAAAGHMTWGAMNESLETFQRWFWVSLVLFILYAWLLVFRIRWRESWLRYTAAESAFWSRLGLPRNLAALARRFGESRAATVCLWIIVILFALLTFLNAGAYLYFKHRMAAKPQSKTALMDRVPASQEKPLSSAVKTRQGNRRWTQLNPAQRSRSRKEPGVHAASASEHPATSAEAA